MALTQQARRALVLYGSETGNAQDVAEELGRITERLRFGTEVAELNAVTLKQLLQYEVLIVAISTTGQGELPANSQTFWRALRNARLRSGCLQQVNFVSFGLGDSSYPKFNWAHRKLYNRLVQLGACPIFERGESDEQHPEGIDGSFLPWSISLRQKLLQDYPLPDGLEPIPDGILLEPKWVLDFADGNEGVSSKNEHTYEDPDASKPDSNGDSPDVPSPGLLQIPNGFAAQITANERVTPIAHWQDVRHLKLEAAGSRPYVPGDVLTIYPKNFPSDVNDLLKLMGWESIADTAMRFVPSQSSTAIPTTLPIPHISKDEAITLRELLTNHLDILSIPRRSFFAQLAHYTSDIFHRDRLLEFTNPEYIDELYDYTTRPRRSILEVLQEFESVKIPWQRVCSIIPTLRGRQFSIASAARADTNKENTTNIELLIAIVKYKTVIKRIRQGVATRYISSLAPRQQITVTLSKGGLGVNVKEIERPVVMMGPGTGVAPMRSLIYQRLHWRQELGIPQDQSSVKDLLFFGCRNAAADYFFKDEWENLMSNGAPLQVFTAFSRDQRTKIYVQDLVRQQASLLYATLATQNGILYICGSSGRMPQAVREALIEVFQSEGAMERQGAEGYLAQMEKEGRYRQETW